MPKGSYSSKQRKVAAVAPPRDKITAADLKKLRSKKKKKKKWNLPLAKKNLLDKHSEHHSDKHMEFMKRRMRAGDTFTQAHKRAQAKVGKWERNVNK